MVERLLKIINEFRDQGLKFCACRSRFGQNIMCLNGSLGAVYKADCLHFKRLEIIISIGWSKPLPDSYEIFANQKYIMQFIITNNVLSRYGRMWIVMWF